MAHIQVKNLYKIFGPHARSKALKMVHDGKSKDHILKETGCTVGVVDASFEINPGEIFVVMGLSGSGKSTALRCLNRLYEPTSGEILLDGSDVVKANSDQLREIRRHQMSMVFQHFGLLPHRSVESNVAFGLEIQGVDQKQRINKAHEALELVGLKNYAESMVGELSGGMQQRVGLARALATDPEILLMDEAFSALDPLIRTQLQDDLLDLQGQMHKSIVFITHDLDEALKIGDRIAIMKDGKIVQIGDPEEILTNPADDYVRSFVENVDRSRVITARTVMLKPAVIGSPKDGPHVAVRKMEKMGVSTLYVVNHDRQFVGVVSIDDAVGSVKQNKQTLEDILVKDITTIDPEQPIAELLTLASENKIPIPVLNEKRVLLGVVTRAAILAGIAGGPSQGEDIEHEV